MLSGKRIDEPTSVQPTWPRIDEWFAEVIQRITEAGIAIPGGARILEQRRLLREVAKNPRLAGPFADRMPEVVSAFADIMQLRVAVAKNSRQNDPIFSGKLLEALKDATSVSAYRSTPTPGRDTQFELFALACMKNEFRARFRPPPGADIEISRAPFAFVAEAKRIRSVSQLAKRARKAANQVAMANCPGLFITDISLMLPHLGVARTVDDAGAHLASQILGFMGRNANRIPATPPNGLIAWSAFANKMYMIDGHLCGPIMYWCHTNVCAADDVRWRFAEQLFAAPIEYLVA